MNLVELLLWGGACELIERNPKFPDRRVRGKVLGAAGEFSYLAWRRV